MNEIAVRNEPQTLALPEQMEYAKIVTTGDMVPQAYKGKPANALIAIGLGQAMGLSPAESLYRIDVIQGKPTASAELIAANVRKAGHKLRVSSTPTSATAQIIRADDPDYSFEVTRDMDWAKSMGLTSKDNYKKQAVTMLQWRAISAVARLACPEALYGVAYTPDELSDMGERRATPTMGVDRLKAAAAPQPPADETTGEIIDPDPERDWPAEIEAADTDQLRALWAEAPAEYQAIIEAKAKEATA